MVIADIPISPGSNCLNFLMTSYRAFVHDVDANIGINQIFHLTLLFLVVIPVDFVPS